MLRGSGPVFADPKFYDIPNTVANGVKKLSAAGAKLITVHASGGIPMMEAAVQAVSYSDCRILAVTVLTSFQEDDVRRIYGGSIQDTVIKLALDAELAGVHGLVCAPKDLEFLAPIKELAGMLLVTPNLSPTWYRVPDDQNKERQMTPGEAAKLGANLFVIGRPILKDADPAAAVERTLAEIEAVVGKEGGK